MDEEWQVSGPFFRQQISDHRWAFNSTIVKTVCNWIVCFISNLIIWQNVKLQFEFNLSACTCKLSSPADASWAILITELQLEINQTSSKILWVKTVTWMWRRDTICAVPSAACCTSAGTLHTVQPSPLWANQGMVVKIFFIQKNICNFYSFWATEMVFTSKWGRILQEIHCQSMSNLIEMISSRQKAGKLS